MTTWGELAAAPPDLAEPGLAMLYEVGVGLAFLATVRPDGGPRLHPMCPILAGDRLYAFIVPGPKQRDLQRDGRYALHSFPRPDDENAFYLTGTARVIHDPATRRSLSDQFVAERAQFHVPPPEADHLLVEFDIDRCLLTTTTGHGDPAPKHEVWSA